MPRTSIATTSETGRVLGLRALNRATLARQLLLCRSDMAPIAALEHLAGLQAQTPHTWYVGLWSRLNNYHPEQLSQLLAERQVVRIALMRSTIHLVSARDCLAFRPLVQPVIERSMNGNFGKHLKGIDAQALIAAGRAQLERQPLTFAELGRLLGEQWPDRDVDSLNQAIRAWLPLVQVPPRGLWGVSGPIAHTTAEAWLGAPLEAEPSLEAMVLRYLAAFGPATVKDIQTWSGLTKLREVVERLRPQLVTFYDEQQRELFDLPDAPRPDPETPVPVRFLYDFDNLLLSHADRTRVITDGYHQQNFSIHGPMPCIVLVDGFTNATWRIEQQRATATMVITPFRSFSSQERDAVAEEGERLLGLLAGEATTRQVEFAA